MRCHDRLGLRHTGEQTLRARPREILIHRKLPRDQSTEAPSRTHLRSDLATDSCFHFQTRSTNFPRPQIVPRDSFFFELARPPLVGGDAA